MFFNLQNLQGKKTPASLETLKNSIERITVIYIFFCVVSCCPLRQRTHTGREQDMPCLIFSGGPLSALTCCVNVRLLSGDKKNIAVNIFSKLGWELGLYYASYDDFHPDILARMYT